LASYSAFSHKAGIHSKAILAKPETYEILNPSDWGVKRCKYPPAASVQRKKLTSCRDPLLFKTYWLECH
jgi:homocitrate synthase